MSSRRERCSIAVSYKDVVERCGCTLHVGEPISRWRQETGAWLIEDCRRRQGERSA